MNTLVRRAVIAMAILGFLNPVHLWAQARPMAEFGKSVQFDKSWPNPSLLKLKGKAVLVVFFQSWCGICNGWAPDFIKQMEAAHGDNRSLVMIAIKTDGGGLSAATEYFKSKGADMDKWYIGSDKDAAFYLQLVAKTGLWQCTIVGADGNIVRGDGAGAKWASGPNSGQYALANSTLLEGCGTLGTVLPADKVYPSELNQIIRLVELRSFGKALSMCASGSARIKDKEALKALKQDILGVADAYAKARLDILKGAGDGRYDAYKELSAMAPELRDFPVGREVNAVLVKLEKDPAIQKEKMAQGTYWVLRPKLKKAAETARPKIVEEMKLAAEKYKGTKYGGFLARPDLQAP